MNANVRRFAGWCTVLTILTVCLGCGMMDRRKQAPEMTSTEKQPRTSTLEDRVRSLEIKIEFLETKLNDIEDQIQGEVARPQ